MAEADYLHVCDFALTGEGGKPCIIGIFDTIQSSHFPTTHPSMYVSTKLQGTPHEVIHAARIDIGRPNGDVVAHFDFPDVTMSADGSANIHIQFANTTFPEAGRYTVRFLIAGRALVTRSIRVNRIQAPAAPPRAH